MATGSIRIAVRLSSAYVITRPRTPHVDEPPRSLGEQPALTGSLAGPSGSDNHDDLLPIRGSRTQNT
jgi:hypothetical protein